MLIEQFVGRGDVEIKLWYANAQDEEKYQWKTDISSEHLSATIYGKSFNWRFLRYCLSHKKQRFVTVGWANTNTKLLHLLFFLLRRPFNHWTDLPDPKRVKVTSYKRTLLRRVGYGILRNSRCKVFCVGKVTVECFLDWGFPASKLVNLPIFVSVDEDIEAYKERKLELMQRYDVPHDGFMISAGSRLIYDKGYDLLIKAIEQLSEEIRYKLKVIIVGSGEESNNLVKKIDDLGLNDTICLENWLDITDFKSLIANSDVFVHPSRFDAYGGTILGMALGVSVIGSTGAGAAVDRIVHGINGFIYEVEDTHALADYITQLLTDPDLKQRLSRAGRETALQWHPQRGVEILLEHSI